MTESIPSQDELDNDSPWKYPDEESLMEREFVSFPQYFPHKITPSEMALKTAACIARDPSQVSALDALLQMSDSVSNTLEEDRFDTFSHTFEAFNESAGDKVEIVFKKFMRNLKGRIPSDHLQLQFEGFEDDDLSTKKDILGCLPNNVQQKLLWYFDQESLKISRLICTSWNKYISTSESFLLRSSFILGSTLDLVKVCKSTKVKWRNVKCCFLPCPETGMVAEYHQQYFMSKLFPDSKTFLSTSVTTIMLDNFEIQKENLIKWLNLCKNLRFLHMLKCSFKKSATSWMPDVLQKSSDKLRHIVAKEMTIESLVDFGRLVLIHTKKLRILTVSQVGQEGSKGPRIKTSRALCRGKSKPLRIKNLEDELTKVLIVAMERNRFTLKSLRLYFETFQTPSLHSKILTNVGLHDINLTDFAYVVRSAETKQAILSPKALHIDHLWPIRSILKSSPSMRFLHIPFLTLDFSDIEDIVWDFPPSLSTVEAQFVTPIKISTLAPDGISQRCSFSKLSIHGKIPKGDEEWADFCKCTPWLSRLELLTGSISDSDLQCVIKHFPRLVLMKLEAVKGLSDSGVTGLDKTELIELKRLWDNRDCTLTEEPPRTRPQQLAKSLRDMQYLRKLRIRGEFVLTDIAIAYGLGHQWMETLELSGSTLQITPTGLHYVGMNCPSLKSLTIQLPKTNSNSSGINPNVVHDILKSKFRNVSKKNTKIEYA